MWNFHFARNQTTGRTATDEKQKWIFSEWHLILDICVPLTFAALIQGLIRTSLLHKHYLLDPYQCLFVIENWLLFLTFPSPHWVPSSTIPNPGCSVFVIIAPLKFKIHTYLMFCAIWYHLYNFKNVKNTHGGVLLLVK